MEIPINLHLASQPCRLGGRYRDASVKRRAIISQGLVGIIFLAGALGAAVMPSDPTAMVKAVIDQTTVVVRDTQTPTTERDKKLREIAEANFDFADMARTTLGYHWRQISSAQ